MALHSHPFSKDWDSVEVFAVVELVYVSLSSLFQSAELFR